jgi:hypothetical protein
MWLQITSPKDIKLLTKIWTKLCGYRLHHRRTLNCRKNQVKIMWLQITSPQVNKKLIYTNHSIYSCRCHIVICLSILQMARVTDNHDGQLTSHTKQHFYRLSITQIISKKCQITTLDLNNIGNV